MYDYIVDLATWAVLAAVAVLASAAGQDWSHAKGRILGAGAALAVVGAALKTFPRPAAAGPKPATTPAPVIVNPTP